MRNVPDRLKRETRYVAAAIGNADNPERPLFKRRHEPEIFEALILMDLLYFLQRVVTPPDVLRKISGTVYLTAQPSAML